MAIPEPDRSIRLNLGAGMQQIAGWMSYDLDPELGPDIVGDVEDLSMFPDCSVDEIYASHVLEHVAFDSPALGEWCRVLKPGARITVAVPDINQIFYLWRQGMVWGPYQLPIDEAYMQAAVFGAHLLEGRLPESARFTKEGHTHKQFFINDMLIQQMLRAGFENVSDVTFCDVRKKTPGEVMVQGTKPRAYSSDCYSDEPWCLRRRPPKQDPTKE